MKYMTKTSLFLIVATLFLLNSSNTAAQDFNFSPDNNYRKYLDDGRKMGKSNIIAINAFGLASGFASFNYTRKISPDLSATVIGESHIFQKNYAPWIYRRYPMGYDQEASDRPIKGGYGYGAQLTYYLNKGAVDHGSGVSLIYRNRVLKADNKYKLDSKEYCFSYSSWILYGKQIAIGGETYFGGASVKVTKDGKDDPAYGAEGPFAEENFTFLFGYQLKIGLFF